VLNKILVANRGEIAIRLETTLMDDMKRTMEKEKSLEEKRSPTYDKRRIAAISAGAAIPQIIRHARPKQILLGSVSES
jgi:acetyl/propionyl-CoA carboxylase alpha subunit